MNNWHKFIQLSKSRVPLFTETSLNLTVLVLHRVKNIIVITEPIITTLFDRVLKLRQFQATEGFCAYLKK
jgi:hypothetical protein